MATAPTPLRDIAKVIRSKNAGPFEITLDIVFKTKADFEAVKKSGVITRELVSQLYNVPSQDIITFGFFDLINAVKITLPRPRPQGGIGETDMHAAQQHVPLQEIRVPWPGAMIGRRDLLRRRGLWPSPVGSAEAWPARPIKLVAPFAGRRLGLHQPAGRGEDGARLGQTMIVENKPGAGGNLGAEAAIKSPPTATPISPSRAATRSIRSCTSRRSIPDRHRGDRPVHRRAHRARRQPHAAGADAQGAGRALQARTRQAFLRVERTGRADPSRHRILPRRRRHQGHARALSRHGAGAHRPLGRQPADAERRHHDHAALYQERQAARACHGSPSARRRRHPDLRRAGLSVPRFQPVARHDRTQGHPGEIVRA